MAGEPQGVTVLTVEADGAGQRLDVFLAARTGGVSRAKVQKLIAGGSVRVNGAEARAKDLLVAGDSVAVVWPAPPPSGLTPAAMALDVLFEDDQLIVVNKPPGLTVHPGAGDTGPTLVEGLLYHCGTLGQAEAVAEHEPDPTAWARPGIVHRLDKDTSGVMVAAKTDKAHAALARQFHDKKQLRREYTALLDGVLAADEVTLESYLFRDPASRLRFASMPVAEYRALALKTPKTALKRYRYARSLFLRAADFGGRLTLASVRLHTGRTHQIRVHAKALGLPVVGDRLYGRALQLPQTFPLPVRQAAAAATRQMLHARILGFIHPRTGKAVCFEAPPPADFQSIIDMLEPFRRRPVEPIRR